MTTAADSPTLLHAFLDQVDKHPQRVAVIDGSRRIRYRDLARAAEKVRQDLAGAGVRPADHVGISMQRSWRVVAAIVGTLAAGARYVPLDPSYPQARVDFMAADSGLRVACCDAGRPASVPLGLTQVPVSGDAAAGLLAPEAAESSGYVIYTSGSTGRPKGVVIPQRHVLSLFGGACQSHFSFSCEDVWTFFHSYSFDFSVWEIWGALLFGGAIVIVDDAARRDPGQLLTLLHEHRVSVLSQVPSPFKYLSLRYGTDPRPLRSLRYVVFGGEALDKPSVRTWLSLRDGPEQLVNMYGITETTVHVTAKVVTPADVADDSSPTSIGVALPHLEVALVRADGAVAGAGEPGEMWVAGSTLSPGYVGNPDLTAEKFVTRDLGTGTRRWYRSGDVASRQPDGDLVYLDRLDSQVNLRGFRIELGEIEAALRHSGDVRDAAATVVALPGDERTLVAAVMPADPTAPPAGEALREMCRGRLPSYMVPDRVMVVDRIPVTPGGEKVDRKAIAAMAAGTLAMTC
ncbi:MAG TPA: amino acid adenylation domain-containing protein [Micromonosporaceae bacterium]|nr:amino acid adenylation domain-containing protein [Micromonosporaceae bacterium]